MTTFERIKKYAKIRGMSLQKVAIEAGLSKNMIYQYKDGTNPSMKTLHKIAEVLHVEPNDLLSSSTETKADGKIKWKDLGMPYGGNIPDELNDMIDSIAETYLKNHPELIKDKYKGKW